MSEELATVSEPAADATAAVAPAAAIATILFVDDEPSILSALRRLFRPQGYKVLMAEGGAAGLALLELESVDLVVSDMRMPEMDGVQFLEQVRQRWPAVVRVMLTGYADISSTIGAINRGEIHRYIAKPWDDQDILLSVSDGLTRSRLERENRQLVQLTQEQNLQLQSVNGQLNEANTQLQEVNGQLQTANQQLHGVNEELELRVKARTQELEASNGQLADANVQLGAANAQMEKANQQLNAANLQLEENFALSISVFAGLLELRDGSVAGHGHRVATLARRMAEQMDLSAVEVTDIYNAGLLHEVGKIGLPDHLLQKTVSLMTGDEFEQYKLHPQHAQAALMPLGRLRQTAVIIRAQHERVDGKGFPDGLQGLELPLGAQIIQVAATFESLISGRLAEKVYSTEDAATAIREGLGTRQEAAVQEAFDTVLQEMAAEAGADMEVPSDQLKAGMVLSRPVLSPHGNVLLPAAFRFTPPVIKQVLDFEQRLGQPFSFFVKKPQDAKSASASKKPAQTAPVASAAA
ncbi:response regulator [Paucibacter sp. TC2R-5]|uniref:HD domain-containing phosphohydrolase n=1 Tax=Paucibacter sp. TC2R-5 TaxID=2893555 RepID=UPI0021E45165|nr:HD domain-containing phosphohydrolase [Paucibacter sp. TC2R-5]MCV2359851.1 response regulator [Paucibacter sp. TC2R-5]